MVPPLNDSIVHSRTSCSKYNTKHRTIGMKPKDIKPNDGKLLLHYFSLKKKKSSRKSKFKVGDAVRVSKYNNVLEKGHTPNN